MRMDTNYTNKTKLIHPKLSYILTGIFFDIHNHLGRYSREKQYADVLEKRLQELKIPFKREFKILNTGNKVDFLIDEKIIVEIKAKRLILKEDYYQVQRYLQSSGVKLGLIVNFRNRYLKPIRIIKIDTPKRKKYQ